MEGLRSRWFSLGASLLGHLVLIATAAGVGLVARPTAPLEPGPIPVDRAADAPTNSGSALRLIAPDGGIAGEADADGSAVPLETTDPRYRPYLQTVRQRIWERWSAPASATGRPALGTLVVEFTLTRSGRIAASGVREPSGNPALDHAALAAVERAVPFSPLPESIAGDVLRVCARFTYD